MYLSDMIGKQYMKWEPGDKVFINTQTGSGKTTFILKSLLPYAMKQQKRIVLLVNRSILDSQIKDEIAQKYSAYQGHIDVYTYQKYVLMSNRIQADYFVLDEAHYFIADATFNEHTEICFRELTARKNSVIIMMSATPEYIYLSMAGEYKFIPPYIADGEHRYYNFNELDNLQELIYGKEYRYNLKEKENSSRLVLESLREDIKKLYGYVKEAEKKNSKTLLYYQEQLEYMEKELYKHSHHFRNQYNEICKIMKRVRDGCWIYDNNNNYSYLNVMYYNKWEDLFKKIKCSGKDKWIYFVNSKERGESYVEEMKKNGIDAIFLNKDSRRKRKTLDEYQTYAKIVKDSMFEQQVLVATSFMDNGINICDPLVKHITIDTENQTEFLQMLGRIRIDPTWYDYHITLYLENKSVERIQKNFNNTIMEDIRFIARFKYLKEKSTYFSLDDDLKVLHTLKDRDIVKNGKFKERYAKYLVEDSITANDEHGREYIIQKYTINKFSQKKNSYDYYKMMAWLEEIYETREKVLTLQEFGNNEEAQKYNIEYPWIKYQLKWIQKAYDPTKWIHITNHKNTEEELYRMLEMYCDTYLTEEYEKYLKTLIIRYGASMQPTHPIANTKCSRVKAVNEAFQEWDIPYYIEKKHKSINGKQRDYWRIVRNTTLCE